MAAFLDVTIQFVHKDGVFHVNSQLHTVRGFGIMVKVHCSAFVPAHHIMLSAAFIWGSHATVRFGFFVADTPPPCDAISKVLHYCPFVAGTVLHQFDECGCLEAIG